MTKANKSVTLTNLNTSLAWRIISFFVLFLLISGTVGPRIVNHGLVGEHGFQVYGGAGKALLFGSIAFGVLAYRKKISVHIVGWQRQELLWLLPAVLAYGVLWLAITKLQQGTPGVLWPVLTHVCLIASVLCAALVTLGPRNLTGVASRYRTELLLAVGLGIAFFVFLTVVYGLWRYLSTIVLHSSAWLLRLSGLYAVALPHYTLLLDKFSVQISEYCSGIESIALFTGLFAIIAVLDWQRFNHRRLLAVFVPALIVLFACNILRVYLLVLAGYYINQHIAFSLFHTYAGMVFFILYSGVFWYFAYNWLQGNQSKNPLPDRS